MNVNVTDDFNTAQGQQWLQSIHDYRVPLLVVSTCLIAVLLSRPFSNSKSDNEGGLPASRLWQWDPFLGLDTVYGQMTALKTDTYLDWLQALHKGHKKSKTFSLQFFTGRWIYTIEPDILKAVYSTKFKDFGVEPIRRNSKFTMPFADKGVNTTDGEDWQFSRALIQPFFERDVYHDTGRIKSFADSFMALFPAVDGETFDVQPLLQRWFLDINSDFIFGKSMDSLIDPSKVKFATDMVTALRGARLRAQSHRFMWAFNWGWWLEAINDIHAIVNAHIIATYKELDERDLARKNGQERGPERTDLLWIMAQQMRNDLEGLRSQVCLIIVPTNDTTSMFIANCIWYLARHPEAWEKLRQEVAEHGNKPLTFDVLRNMVYLNGVMNETHRLIPNNVTQVRACVADTVLPIGGGRDGQAPLAVRKGDIVTVSKNVMYRDPDYWGADADEYRPERWVGRRGTWGFVPYGGGPRRCPAQMMVQTECAYMLVRIAQKYRRLESRDSKPYQPVMRIGPSNKHGVKIALYK
ncbi:Cytochrome P450 monooxygenase tenA [Colletotrichum viniferum]|nr:Cytochrome P450 monooxygenase tenA [Colletotrichum viniferum]